MSEAQKSANSVVQARARLGEGPAWDAETQSLYWVDIYNHRVHQYFPDLGTERTFEVGDVVACAIPAGSQKLIIGLRHELAWLHTATGEVERILTLEEDKPKNRLNDAKCDLQGRLWFGSMSREEGEAALYRYDPDGGLHVMETGITIFNGPAWSPDQKTFYFTDSPKKTIYAYDYDADSGRISRRRVFADLSHEEFTPDGTAVDAEGHLWSAQWDGGCLLRLAPDGREVARISMPVKRPTSCAFAGEDLRQLYVTSASVGLSEEEIEESFESGDLFRVDVGVQGLPVGRFGG